jgi:hypothetical protein
MGPLKPPEWVTLSIPKFPRMRGWGANVDSEETYPSSALVIIQVELGRSLFASYPTRTTVFSTPPPVTFKLV